MKATFAYWGYYTIAFNALFKKLKIDIITPQKSTSETIKKGAMISPEMFCFPLKVNIGNYLEAMKKGADTVFMATNTNGNCRFRYYPYIQKEVLENAGYKINFVIFDQNPLRFFKEIKKVSRSSLWQVFEASFFAFQKMKIVESLENKKNYLMPRAIDKKQVSNIFQKLFEETDKIKNIREIFNLKRDIKKKISEIKFVKKNIPKVGIIGEIYTVSDDSINYNIEEKLGIEGIEVHRELNLSYHVMTGLFPWKKWKMYKKISPYLKSTVGGHGREAVYETLDYVKQGFDGIVHLLPFGCMPEVSVRPILEKIHKEAGIPFLSLSLDEEIAEAGVNTRIEAFVDVVENYYRGRGIQTIVN